MSAAVPLVELREISKSYASGVVLRDLSLALREGEHTALLGASGCGKSTALRLLAGLEAPCSGEILFQGAVASAPGRILVPPHRRRLAMVFQDLGLWPAQSVSENVLLGLEGSRLSRSERRDRVMAALDLCRIATLGARLPGSLSGGEQQRVALARAIAGDPILLLLDEPFAGLDLATKADLLTDLRRLRDERGLTLCLVTHDPTEALALCTHALVMGEGTVLEGGTWEAVLREPHSPLLRAFRRFSSAPAPGHSPWPSRGHSPA